MPTTNDASSSQSRVKPLLGSEGVRHDSFSASLQKRSSKAISNGSVRASMDGPTVVNQAANLNLNRIVLYKRGHFIETANAFFVIEISSSADGSLYIAAFDI